MLNAIIVDDEPHSREVMKTLVSRFCPDVKISGVAASAEEARQLMKTSPPDLIFLDIEMPVMNGLEMVEQGLPEGTNVIFVTSYAHYAIPALRLSAVDYLLKPVAIEDLLSAVIRAKERKEKSENQPLDILRQNLKQSDSLHKIAIPGVSETRFITISDIIRIEADSNYSFIFLENRERIHCSRTLGDFEDLLSHHQMFMRVHKTHLVNLTKVVRLIKGEGAQLLMSDDSVVEISRRRKNEVLELLGL